MFSEDHFYYIKLVLFAPREENGIEERSRILRTARSGIICYTYRVVVRFKRGKCL